MTDRDVDTLRRALAEAFDAEVDATAVNGNGRYRFAVLSNRFAGMPQLDRQDAIWRVVDEALSRAAVLDISLIFAFAPDEIEQAA